MTKLTRGARSDTREGISNHPSRIVQLVFSILLFIVAFLPRVIQQVEIYSNWHIRGRLFIEAVFARQLEDTLLGPHPGVTTMWLAGLAQQVGSLFDPDFTDRTINQQVDIELIPIALVIALVIVLSYFLMAEVFDPLVAGVATLFLALDPYHISVSAGVHVDALLSVFLMVSALFLWVYTKNQLRRYLIWSGLFAGLALLTKAPALFLVPYLLLVLGVNSLAKWISFRNGRIELPDRNHYIKDAGHIAVAILIWLIPFVVIYFLLWPSLWVQPAKTLNTTFGLANYYIETAHERPVFFMGQPTVTDPGPLFYPLNMLFKTTAITLVGFLMSIPLLFNRKLENHKRLAILYGLFFIGFFAVMMSLGDKKVSRYALPALQFVILLAAVGFVYFSRWITKGRKNLYYLSLAVVIVIQAVISISRHPYYGTHYNYLLGGPNRILESNIISGQEKGEGLEISADYLNRLPLSQLLVVASNSPVSFMRYFDGKTVPITDDKVDYLLFSRSAVLRRDKENQWGALWDDYKDRQPKLVVEFDGVPYTWLFKTGPIISGADISHPVSAAFGEDVHLLGYDFEPAEAMPGETIQLTLYWEGSQETDADYTVFTHLLDPNGQLLAQRDSQPQGGMYPTYLWHQSERIQDVYTLTVDSQAPPGEYNFAIGMYTLETLQRLPITLPDGESVDDNRLLLPGPTVFKPES
jgi:hypothetical protein